MHYQHRWSISLGRWIGIPVRLHALFLIVSVFAIYLASISPKWVAGPMVFYTVAGLLCLLSAVVIRELVRMLV